MVAFAAGDGDRDIFVQATAPQETYHGQCKQFTGHSLLREAQTAERRGYGM